MERRRETVRMQVDAYTRVCLTAIAVLLTLTVIGLWGERGPGAPAAQARTYAASDKDAPGKGSEDTTADKARVEQVSPFVGLREEAVKTNEKLQEVINCLRSGEVKVQVVKGEKGERAEKSEPAADKPEKPEGDKDGSQ
ncbi:MAG: hypothetical protein NT031_01455 [Planctomycetota bacterium]|nr:hypothetical protein [Planctomycetota bacterium]